MYIANPSVEQVMAHIQTLAPSQEEVICLFFGEKTDFDFNTLVQTLNTQNIRFVGGVFPGIIHGRQNSDQGVLVQKLRSTLPIKVFDKLDLEVDQYTSLATQVEKSTDEHKQTALVLVDGLASNIATFLVKLYNLLGNSVSYIGGGAGSLSLEQSPCLLTSEGLLEDAAVLCFIDQPSKLSVKHGWETIGEPIIATRTEKNIVYELNWQNAFEVYQAVVNENSDVPIGIDNFFDVAKGFPFGMSVEGQEAIVRDPLSVTEEGALVCVGEVHQNAVLTILQGKTTNLVNAAKQATQEVTSSVDQQAVSHLFVVDCISRTLFLEDDFSKELAALVDNLPTSLGNQIPFGILSLGEVSSKGNSPIYFYNKTMVLGAFL